MGGGDWSAAAAALRGIYRQCTEFEGFLLNSVDRKKKKGVWRREKKINSSPYTRRPTPCSPPF